MFEKLGFISQGINGKIDGTKKQFKCSMLFESSEFELVNFECMF